jgi:hypothetical protein
VASSQDTTGPLLTKASHLLDEVDSVYFLLFPGWENELRGNRWHFAVRWARYKPVVLVIPTVTQGPATSVSEPRIPGCRILRIHSGGHLEQLAKDTQIQVGQVLDDLEGHRFERPLLWCYNSNLVGLYARLPAVARLFHATEAHFDFPDLASSFHLRLRAAVAISDVTVAVSDGVAASIRNHVEGAPVVTVANGCDYRHYSLGKPDEELATSARAYTSVAIYAGNINDRLDFELLKRLATQHPDVLFALYGPLSQLPETDMRVWRNLLDLKNVHAPGAVDPDRLRDLYAAADVGIIPYRPLPHLVNNGLPLKALEMCATGLPVVSSMMKPLMGLAAGIAVTSNADEFLGAFAMTSRATLSPAQLKEMNSVSLANDYDNKFEQILAILEEYVIERKPVTRVDRLIEVLGSVWFASEVRLFRWVITAPPPPIIAANLVTGFARLVPTPLRRRIKSNRFVAAVRESRRK